MPDLKTELATYLEASVRRIEVDDIYSHASEGTPVQLVELRAPTRRTPTAVYVAVAAIVILLAAGIGLVVNRVSLAPSGPLSGATNHRTEKAVAATFMRAWSTRDLVGVEEMLAATATLDGGDIDRSDLAGLLDWYPSLGWDIRFRPFDCLWRDSDVLVDGTVIDCPFTLTVPVGGEPGPEIGSVLRLVIDGGLVTSVDGFLAFTEWGNGLAWQTFAGWVETRHPDDFAVMFADDRTHPRVDQASIAAWTRLVEEYGRPPVSLPGPLERICEAATEDLLADLAAVGIGRLPQPPAPQSMTVDEIAMWSASAVSATEGVLDQLPDLDVSEALLIAMERQVQWLRELHAAATVSDTGAVEELLTEEDRWNLDPLVQEPWGCPIGTAGLSPPVLVSPS